MNAWRSRGIEEYIEDTGQQIVYYGYRPQDSLCMHESYSAKKPCGYSFVFPARSVYMMIDITRQMMSKYCASLMRNRGREPRPKGMVPGTSTMLEFDSDFESGNLDLAATKSPNEYDLFMRTDSNTRGHHQWFFFSVRNKSPGTVRLNVLNFTKDDSLYNQGMRVAVFSEKKAELARRDELPQVFADWHRGGDNIEYKISRMSAHALPQQQCVRKKKAYYELAFDYNFEYPDDKVFFAYSIPYTYSKLNTLLEQMRDSQTRLPPTETYLAQSVLCKSLSGLDIPLLTITGGVSAESEERVAALSDKKSEKEQTAKKPVMIVTARIHPGETCGSFMMHGFLRFIASDSNPEAARLREQMVFKVVPMMNPDGVIIGNYRACLAGQDLNRKFSSPDPRLHPEICAVKEMIARLQADGREVLGYIDLHAHSKKKCVFVYGPYYPLHSARYMQVRVLAKLLAGITQMFRYNACKFRQDEDKMTAARLVISREFDIMNSLTLEASFYGYIDADRKTVEFRQDYYEAMGEHIGGALLEYTRSLGEEKQLRLQRLSLKRGHKRSKGENRRAEQQEIVVVRRPSEGDAGECAKVQNRTCPAEKTVKPPEPERVVRVEDASYKQPEMLGARPQLKEIYASIQEDLDKEACTPPSIDSSSDSDSAESEIDPLTKEEETQAITAILATLEGYARSASNSSRAPSKMRNKSVSSGKHAKKTHKKVSLTELSPGKARSECNARTVAKTQEQGVVIVQKPRGDTLKQHMRKPAAAHRSPEIKGCAANSGLMFGGKDSSPPANRRRVPYKGLTQTCMVTLQQCDFHVTAPIIPMSQLYAADVPQFANGHGKYHSQVPSNCLRVIPEETETRNGQNLNPLGGTCLGKKQSVIINYPMQAPQPDEYVVGCKSSIIRSNNVNRSCSLVRSRPAPTKVPMPGFAPTQRIRRPAHSSSLKGQAPDEVAQQGREGVWRRVNRHGDKNKSFGLALAEIEMPRRRIRRMRPTAGFRRFGLFMGRGVPAVPA